MQFNKVLIALQALLLIFITFYLETALTASRTHQKGRSASLRIFPVHQRQLEGHGRSALDLGFEYDKEPVLVGNAEEGRGLMKKFLLFKSLFTQQKSEPTSNVIIITQPAAADGGTQAPTTTMPTTTGTTTTMASKADTPTVGGNTGRGTQAQNEQDDEDVFGVLEESEAEDIVQQLIKQTKPNKMRLKKLNGQLTESQKQQQQRQQWQRQRQQQRQQHLQRNKRNRVPQTKPQRNRQQENQMLLLNKINLSQQPNQKSSNNNSNNNNYNKHNGSHSNNTTFNNNNNMASGILNLNTNMRLQNIMNAFRKQTPIVYNY